MTQYNKITKKNIDKYLNELAKEYKKLTKGKARGDLIIVGGTSIAINYSFRDTTTDADSIIECESPIEDAIKKVAFKYNLPEDWLNSDFKRTNSYTNKLGKYSVFYKTFCNYLTIYTVKNEYLIAMKLMSSREYKNDLSDIVGILTEHHKNNDDISLEKIKKAVISLYGDYRKISKTSRDFIENICKNDEYLKLYNEIKENENNTYNIANKLDISKLNDNNISRAIYEAKTKKLLDKYLELGLIKKVYKDKSIKEVNQIISYKLHDLYNKSKNAQSYDSYIKELLGEAYIIYKEIEK